MPSVSKNSTHESAVAMTHPIRSLSKLATNQSPVYMTVLSPTAPSSGFERPTLPSNIDGPDHRLQVNEELLFEHEFHGNCYVSAHLQRLQHGIFADSVLHGERPLRVTFMAVTFVFHPSISMKHRFQSAVIEITARSHDKEPLRFIKFAPHLAYGRISSETLKWSFQLGATVGVSQGPANLAVQPKMTTEKDKVLGAMMKIQGSTRSQNYNLMRVPDTKLVWSLEENDQQEAGLPREFTFAFLIARPERNLSTKSKDSNKKIDLLSQGLARFPTGHGLDHAATFGPMHVGISVKPHITNMLNHLPFDGQYEEALVVNEVGQRLLVQHVADPSSPDGHSASRYYNFAKMPGNFEDLVELPGNSVTSVEPSLPPGGAS